MNTKIKALATYLKIDTLEIAQLRRNLYEGEGREYLVLTEEEADELARDNILDAMWAFKAEFIARHSKESLDDESIKALKNTQAQLCESANPITKFLIKYLDSFLKHAIRMDGRGHFINNYDGREDEIKMDNEWFYIYRNN